MGGYAPPPVEYAPATAADAAAIAGASVGYRGTYGGSTGAAAQRYNQMLYEQQLQRQIDQQEQSRQQAITTSQNQQRNVIAAQEAAKNPYLVRPDLVAAKDLGDRQTQALIAQGYSPEQALSIQKNEATSVSAKRYYQNELDKALQTNVSVSSAYHHWAKDTGLPQRANPYEYVGDLSLSLLKGRSQEDAWQNAVHNTTVFPDYTNPVNAITVAKRTGDMGAYGNLQSYSSDLGVIPVEQQQAIAERAAQGAGWTTHPELQQYNPAKNMGEFGFGSPVNTVNAPQPPRSAIPSPGLPQGVVFTGELAVASQGKQGEWPVAPYPGQVIPAKEGSVNTNDIPVLNTLGMIGGLNFDLPTPKGTWDTVFNRPITVESWKQETTTTPQSPEAVALKQNIDTTSSELATQRPVLDAAATDLSWRADELRVQKNALDTTIARKTDEQGNFIGSASEYAQFEAARLAYNQNVDKYTKDQSAYTTQATAFNEKVGMLSTNVDKYNAIAPAATSTVYTAEKVSQGQSGMDRLNMDVSDRIYGTIGGIGGLSAEQYKAGFQKEVDLSHNLAVVSPVFLPVAFGTSAVKGAFDKPVDIGLMFGTAYAGGMVFRGIEAGGAVLGASRVGTAVPAVTKAAGIAWKYGVPLAMGGVYGYTFSERATSGFTDYTPANLATKSGKLFATETVPMTLGFMSGYRFPETAKGIYDTSGRIYDTGQRYVESGKAQFQEKPMVQQTFVGELKYEQKPNVQVPSGIGGAYSYTTTTTIATQPSLFGVSFPKIFSPRVRGAPVTNTIDLGLIDAAALADARLPGSTVNPTSGVRTETLTLDTYRGDWMQTGPYQYERPGFARGTGNLKLAEIRLPRTVDEYLKMGAEDAKLVGKPQEEVVAQLMADATRVTKPTEQMRSLDVTVPAGTSIREAFDWNLNKGMGEEVPFREINMEDYFGAMRVKQTGVAPYQIDVIRDINEQGFMKSGEFDVTGSRVPEKMIVDQLQEISKGLKPGQNELGLAFDNRGNLVYETMGTQFEVESIGQFQAVERLNAQGKGASLAHTHPGHGFDTFKKGSLNTKAAMIIDLFTGRDITNNPSVGRFNENREFIPGDVEIMRDYFHSGIDNNYIVSQREIMKFSPERNKLGFLTGEPLGWQAFTESRVGKLESYNPPGFTEHIPNAAAEMRQSYPVGMREQIVDMVDRNVLKNPQIEFIREQKSGGETPLSKSGSNLGKGGGGGGLPVSRSPYRSSSGQLQMPESIQKIKITPRTTSPQESTPIAKSKPSGIVRGIPQTKTGSMQGLIQSPESRQRSKIEPRFIVNPRIPTRSTISNVEPTYAVKGKSSSEIVGVLPFQGAMQSIVPVQEIGMVQDTSVRQNVAQVQKQDQIAKQMQGIQQVPVQVVRQQYIQEPVTQPRPVPPSTPIIPILGGGSGLSSPSMPGSRGIFGFKEVSPTWTPGEQGMALFTGSFRRQPIARTITKKPRGVSIIKLKKVRNKGWK